MRALIIAAIAALLAGCASEKLADLSRPCGVIADSLRDVQGATPADTRRIDVHFERGVAAGCWTRD